MKIQRNARIEERKMGTIRLNKWHESIWCKSQLELHTLKSVFIGRGMNENEKLIILIFLWRKSQNNHLMNLWLSQETWRNISFHNLGFKGNSFRSVFHRSFSSLSGKIEFLSITRWFWYFCMFLNGIHRKTWTFTLESCKNINLSAIVVVFNDYLP